MNFEFYEEYRVKDWNLNMIVGMSVGVVALIILVFNNYMNEEMFRYACLTMVGLLIMSQFVRMISFFSKYESVKGEKGQLSINEVEISWNKKKIYWESIVDISIQYNEIDNKHQFDFSPQNNVSDGLNRISLETKSGLKLIGYYKLKNHNQLQMLQELLQKCIHKNQLSYDLAKKIIQPENYREHQLLKKEISKNNTEPFQ